MSQLSIRDKFSLNIHHMILKLCFKFAVNIFVFQTKYIELQKIDSVQCQSDKTLSSVLHQCNITEYNNKRVPERAPNVFKDI